MGNFSNDSYQDDSFVEQPLLPAQLYNFLAAYLIFTAVVSLSGNSLVIYIFLKSNLARSPANFFMINMGIANLVESLPGYPMAIISNINHRWSFGFIGCQFYAFFVFTGAVCNITTYCFLGVYRYFMFNSPTFEHIRGKKIGIFICLTWSYAFLWSFCPLVGWGRYGVEPFGTSCSIDWTDKSENNRSYIMSVFLFILAIPFAMIIIFYAKIFFKTRKTVSAVVDCDPDVSIRDPRHGVKSESRAIQNTILENIARSVVVFLIAWTPYACLAVLLTFRLNVSVYSLLVAALLAKTQCAVNIFVYALGFSDFRKELKCCFRTRIQ